MRLFSLLSFFCLCFVLSNELLAQLDGRWHAGLKCPGGQIQFGLVIEKSDSGWDAWLTNGEEKIAVPNVTVDAGVLNLEIDHYDSKIVAKLNDGRLAGSWKKRRGPQEWVELEFLASKTPVSEWDSKQDAARFKGRWSVDFEKSEDIAVGIFDTRKDGSASGTFLTTTGDYRFLSGGVQNGQLELSCFDGAHAFLFKVKNVDGELRGRFWSANTWYETWTAKKDNEARLPDAFQQTKLVNQDSLGGLSFPNLKGEQIRLDAPEFQARARLLYVFGSWCPNCHDAASYFSQLLEKYGNKGLKIQGLAFELTGEFERDSRQVRKYLKRHGVKYPVLVAGLSDKKLAAQKLPFLDKVKSYPTTIFLDQNNQVQAIHTGFTGPATGESYTQMTQKFEALIEKLLIEDG